MRFAFALAKCIGLAAAREKFPAILTGTADAELVGMARRKLHPHGRITKNTVTPGQVNKRARELSLIGGHEPNRRSKSDLCQAKRELRGDDRADAPADEPGITGSGMGTPPASRGHQTPRHLSTDDQDEEQTVQEGVDEAEHSEMLEASKHPTRNEE